MQEEETWDTILLKARKCDNGTEEEQGSPSLLEERSGKLLSGWIMMLMMIIDD